MSLGKIRTKEQIISLFKDGQSIMVGGFGRHGCPNELIDLVLESGVKNLTTISLDAGIETHDVGKLINNGRVNKMIVSHIGKNQECMSLYDSGKIEVEFCPMGTLSERIRAGGMGLGGILVKTGLGTEIEEGKQIINMDGTDYILEKSITSDISLVRARKVDPLGNLNFHGTNVNSNPLVATAGDITIAEADFIMDADEIGSDNIAVCGVFVNHILENRRLDYV